MPSPSVSIAVAWTGMFFVGVSANVLNAARRTSGASLVRPLQISHGRSATVARTPR